MSRAIVATLTVMGEEEGEFVDSGEGTSQGGPFGSRKNKPRAGGGAGSGKSMRDGGGGEYVVRNAGTGNYVSRDGDTKRPSPSREVPANKQRPGSDEDESTVLISASFYLQGADAVTAVKVVQSFQWALRIANLRGFLRHAPHHFDDWSHIHISPEPNVYIETVEAGSVFAKFFKSVADALKKEEAKEITDQVRQGLEANFVDKPQAETMDAMSHAILNLSQAAEGAKNAAFDLGQVKLVKITDDEGNVTITAKAFSSRESAQATAGENEALVRDPEAFKRALDL